MTTGSAGGRRRHAGLRRWRRGVGFARRARRFSRARIVDAQLAEVLVAAGVVAVHVRVDEIPDAAVGDLLDRRDDLVGERRELRVDHEHAVGPGEHADRAALSFERVEVRGRSSSS